MLGMTTSAPKPINQVRQDWPDDTLVCITAGTSCWALQKHGQQWWLLDTHGLLDRDRSRAAIYHWCEADAQTPAELETWMSALPENSYAQLVTNGDRGKSIGLEWLQQASDAELEEAELRLRQLPVQAQESADTALPVLVPTDPRSGRADLTERGQQVWDAFEAGSWPSALSKTLAAAGLWSTSGPLAPHRARWILNHWKSLQRARKAALDRGAAPEGSFTDRSWYAWLEKEEPQPRGPRVWFAGHGRSPGTM